MGARAGKGRLIALDVRGGRELWGTEVGPGSPNSTPTVVGELVFGLGFAGDLLCAGRATGQERWRRNLGKDFGGKAMTEGAFSESLLVDGDRLVCTPGARDAVLVALHRETGELVWKSSLPGDIGSRGVDGAGYSSLVVSNGGGVRQYIQLTGRGLISVAAGDGRVLWTYNRIANAYANISTPLVSGDHVFCSTSYGTGSALLKLVADNGAVRSEEVFFLDPKVMQNHHGGMVLVDGHVYSGHGHNNGFPLCVKLETGEVAWRPGRGPGAGSAAVLCADGHLYFRYENGIMALIEATPEKYVLKGSFEVQPREAKGWSHPVIAHGRLYLRDQDVLLCYDIKAP